MFSREPLPPMRTLAKSDLTGGVAALLQMVGEADIH